MHLHHLADALRAELRARIARGELSQRVIAASSAYSQPHVCHMLSGKRALTVEAIDALMLGTGVSWDDLTARVLAQRVTGAGVDNPADPQAPRPRTGRHAPRTPEQLADQLEA